MDDKQAGIEIREAIKQGDVNGVAALLADDKRRLQMMTVFGTCLHVAAAHGKLEIVKLLVVLGANINARGGIAGGAPINQAAAYGHLEIIKYLLSCGATLDVSEPERNPLFSAIYGGHMDVVNLLVDYGIDVEIKYSGRRMKNMDAVEFAKERGQIDIAKVLAEHWFTSPPLEIDEDRKFAIEMRMAIIGAETAKVVGLVGDDKSRLHIMTPLGTWLHMAASLGKLKIVKELVSRGADMNCIGGVLRGGPLNEAARSGHVEVARFLLSCGAELDVTEPLRNPLFSAIKAGQIDLVKLLVERGADIHIKYITRTPFSYAKECGRPEIAQFLAEQVTP